MTNRKIRPYFSVETKKKVATCLHPIPAAAAAAAAAAATTTTTITIQFTSMGNLFASLFSRLKKRETRVLLLGLDHAGKTTGKISK